MKKSLVTAIVLLAFGMNAMAGFFSSQAPSIKEVRATMQEYENPWESPGFGSMLMRFLHHQCNDYPADMMIQGSMTEVLHKDWENNAWVNSEKELIYLDNNGWMTDVFMYLWDENVWQKFSWSSVTNDPSGRPVELLMRFWEEDVWTDFAKMTYTYNQYGPLQMLMQYNFGGTWMNVFKLDFFYDDGLCTEIITQEWDMVGSAWENDTRDAFTYNANGWMIEELSQWWEEDEWVNSELAVSTYNGNGYETEKLVKSWYDEEWENYLHFTYTYNAQWLLTEELSKIWYNSIWNNHELYMFEYDGQGRVIEELEQYWESSKGWVNYSLASYTYDLSVDVAETGYLYAVGELYPNPASEKASLSFDLHSEAMVSLTLFGYDGTMIGSILTEKRGAGSHFVEIPVGSLPAGIYFVSVNLNGRMQTAKRLLVIR